jgi:hypothetical protein
MNAESIHRGLCQVSARAARLHVIVGLFDVIVEILFKYSAEDFKAPYMYLYPLSGLCKNADELCQPAIKDVLFGLLLIDSLKRVVKA